MRWKPPLHRATLPPVQGSRGPRSEKRSTQSRGGGLSANSHWFENRRSKSLHKNRCTARLRSAGPTRAAYTSRKKNQRSWSRNRAHGLASIAEEGRRNQSGHPQNSLILVGRATGCSHEETWISGRNLNEHSACQILPLDFRLEIELGLESLSQ